MSAPRGSTFYLDGAGKPAASPLAEAALLERLGGLLDLAQPMERWLIGARRCARGYVEAYALVPVGRFTGKRYQLELDGLVLEHHQSREAALIALDRLGGGSR